MVLWVQQTLSCGCNECVWFCEVNGSVKEQVIGKQSSDVLPVSQARGTDSRTALTDILRIANSLDNLM